ncbi:hypothetical protein XBO1_380004 [Xenorhabdus bovienii str. oregonense]|uniref:Uncharacterized protein n=1 Tax=Xenorhabdus bovienii str. oregonense TaxID=1398202 RepID=A0A077PD01_XENBV|nr:hypothetical protein [Xenorhabdus bovienii]CDH07581.1 hypothetical protein XBO1_380004 [Xenorhabdus bovienii str. oregonense]
MSMDIRATMSSAPDEPKNQLGFSETFFLSGYSSGRLTIHVINNQPSQNQMGNMYFTV